MIIYAAWTNKVSKEAIRLSRVHPKWTPDHIRKRHADGTITKRPIQTVRK